MLKNKISIVVFLLSLFVFNNAYSQVDVIPPPPLMSLEDYVFPSSPDASALVEYVNHPTSLFTGTEDISIPLYEVQGRNISLPLSLNYHQSAVRVVEEASWVGLGWTLDAGGVITRNVQGLPDDGPSGYVRESVYFGEEFRPAFSSPLAATECENISQLQFDALPDIFQFNFDGYKGSFTLSKSDGVTNVLVSPYQDIDIKVNYIMDGTLETEINSFTVISENGTKYIFEAKEYSEGTYKRDGTFTQDFGGYLIDIPYSYEERVIEKHAVSWYLSKMIAPNNDFSVTDPNLFNDVIEFTYTPEPTGDSYIGQTLNMSEYKTEPIDGGVCPSNLYFNSHIFNTYERKVYPVYLEKIHCKSSNVEIDFTMVDRSDLGNENWNAKSLSKLSIKHNGPEVKSFIFTHEYSDDSQSMNCKRLLLKELKEKGGDIELNPYIFTYIDPESLPCKDSYQFDHWGHFNGAENSSSLESLGANREADEDAVQVGMLNSIINPLKGSKLYTYELNEFLDEDSNVIQGGGIRIKEVSQSDGFDISLDIDVMYKYNIQGLPEPDSQNSPGKTYNPINDYHILPHKIIEIEATAPYFSVYYDCELGVERSDNVFWNTNIAGYTVGYEEVDKFQNGNGSTNYQFRLGDENYIDEHFPYTPINNLSYLRGQLEEVNIFNESNHELRRINYAYNEIDMSNTNTGIVIANNFRLFYWPLSEEEVITILGPIFGDYSFEDFLSLLCPIKSKGFYKFESHRVELASISERYYDENTTDYIGSNTAFGYRTEEPFLLNSKDISVDSGESISINYTYPKDYPGDAVADGMAAKHMHNYPFIINQTGSVKKKEVFTYESSELLLSGPIPNSIKSEIFLPIVYENVTTGYKLVTDVFDEFFNVTRYFRYQSDFSNILFTQIEYDDDLNLLPVLKTVNPGGDSNGELLERNTLYTYDNPWYKPGLVREETQDDTPVDFDPNNPIIDDAMWNKKEYEYDAFGILKTVLNNDGVIVYESENKLGYAGEAYNYISKRGIRPVTQKQFLDGLGRSVQNMLIGYSNSILSTPMEYNEYGQLIDTRLPIGGALADEIDNLYNAADFYSGLSTDSGSAFGSDFSTEYIYEPSPLNRVQEQELPDFNGNNPEYMNYLVNDATDVVKKWDGLTSLNNYAPGTLYKNVFIDEYGINNIEFRNGIGQKVLLRKNDGGNTNQIDTYYTYDNFGNLTHIIQPQAMDDLGNIGKYAFTYSYDAKQRLKEKTIPGKGSEKYTYDDYDRVITHDNGLEKIYIDYDILGRQIRTSSNSAILTRSFYDQLTNTQAAQTLAAFGDLPEDADCKSKTIYKGTKSAEIVKVLKPEYDANHAGVRDYIINFYNYDDLGRLTYKCSSGFLIDGYTNDAYEYSDYWDITKKTSKVQYPGILLDESIKEYTYDNAGRVTDISQTKESGIPDDMEQVVMNTYDDLGRLAEKNIGGIQVNKYKYTIRGWLTDINQLDDDNCDEIYNVQDPPFGFTGPPGNSMPEMNDTEVEEDCWEDTKMSLYEFYILSELSFNTKEEEAHLANLIYYISEDEIQLDSNDQIDLQNSEQEIKLLELQNLIENNGYIVSTDELLNGAYPYGEIIPLMYELSTTTDANNNQPNPFSLDKDKEIQSLQEEVVNMDLQDNYMESYNRLEEYLSVICYQKELEKIKELNEKALGESLITNGGIQMLNDPDTNEPNPFNHVFALKLSYGTSENGLIDKQEWRSAFDCKKWSYGYTYDWLNRVVSADFFENPSGSTSPVDDDLEWNYPVIESGDFSIGQITYDKNGNMKTIHRSGMLNNDYELGSPVTPPTADTPTFGPIDQLSLTYDGNRLLEVDDALTVDPNLTERVDFNDPIINDPAGSKEYLYDVNGNMTEDLNRGIEIKYNHLNLPESIYRDSGVMHIYYDALGNKLRKQNCASRRPKRKSAFNDDGYIDDKDEIEIEGVEKDLFPIFGPFFPIPNYDCSRNQDYIGEFEYFKSNTDPSQSQLMSINNEEGRAAYGIGGQYFEYVIKDHLGSPRAYLQKVETKVDDINNPGQFVPATNVYLKKESHYYPFGMTMSGLSPTFRYPGEFSIFDNNSAEYNNKEHHDEMNLGWSDYGARWYDPQVGRWWSVDPLADKNHSDSPFNYVMNNPTMYTDKDGRDTLIMHRILLEGDYGTISNVFEVNFTIMSDGYETLVLDNDGNPITYFMISTIKADNKRGNEIERDHPLRFQVRAEKLDKITGKIIDPRAKNDILLYESASGEQFIHWGTSGINWFNGCMGLGKILANDSPAYFDPIVSQKAMQEVRDLHEYYKANLTGKEFILRPYSKPITVGQRRKEILEKLLKE